MAPHQGSGAGQAIEDAYVLGSLLGHPSVTLSTLPIALEIYQKIRLPHANDKQRRSAEAALVYSFEDPRFAHFDAPGGKATRECTGDDAGSLWEMGHALVDGWKWAWTTSVEDDRLRAMNMLEESLRTKEVKNDLLENH